MATTYAALVSLMSVLNRIKNPTCPVSFDQSHIRSLVDNVSTLVEFLEAYSQGISKDLERRMANVAFAAEDTVESYLVFGGFTLGHHPTCQLLHMFAGQNLAISHSVRRVPE